MEQIIGTAKGYLFKATKNGEVDEQAMLKAIDEDLGNKLSFRKSSAKYEVNGQILNYTNQKILLAKLAYLNRNLRRSKFLQKQKRIF